MIGYVAVSRHGMPEMLPNRQNADLPGEGQVTTTRLGALFALRQCFSVHSHSGRIENTPRDSCQSISLSLAISWVDIHSNATANRHREDRSTQDNATVSKSRDKAYITAAPWLPGLLPNYVIGACCKGRDFLVKLGASVTWSCLALTILALAFAFWSKIIHPSIGRQMGKQLSEQPWSHLHPNEKPSCSEARKALAVQGSDLLA